MRSWGLFAGNRRWGEECLEHAGVEGKGRQAQSEAQHRWVSKGREVGGNAQREAGGAPGRAG